MYTSSLQKSNNWRLWTGYDYVARQVTNHDWSAFVSVDWSIIDESRLVIDYFYSKDVRHTINPPLILKWTLNQETGLVEIMGTGNYEDILVYGESLKQAMTVLQEGILSLLWEDCITENDVRLTTRARRMASDLRSRVAI